MKLKKYLDIIIIPFIILIALSVIKTWLAAQLSADSFASGQTNPVANLPIGLYMFFPYAIYGLAIYMSWIIVKRYNGTITESSISSGILVVLGSLTDRIIGTIGFNFAVSGTLGNGTLFIINQMGLNPVGVVINLVIMTVTALAIGLVVGGIAMKLKKQ